MIPQRYAQIAFGFILSGLMLCIVSGIATARAAGWVDGQLSLWMSGWITSWLVAFPVVLFMAPVAKRIVASLTRP